MLLPWEEDGSSLALHWRLHCGQWCPILKGLTGLSGSLSSVLDVPKGGSAREFFDTGCAAYLAVATLLIVPPGSDTAPVTSQALLARRRVAAFLSLAKVLMKGNRSMMKIEPVTLQGSLVRLEPLRLEYAAELYEASRDPGLWTYKPVKQPRSLAEMEQLIASVIQSQQAGACLPFAVLSLERGGAVGETRYHSFMLQDYGLEIGWTWLTPAVQRTGVNTECKYLLLRHAFEVLGAIRVQFRTHHLNATSQRALERLGAVKEGVLRNQLIMPDGSYRHSVYYSIIQSEWPPVKARLENMMQRESIGRVIKRRSEGELQRRLDED